MNTSEIQFSSPGRRRGRYTDEFKAQIIAACRQPGVSTAAVALANGINDNLLRRWIVQSGDFSARHMPQKTGLHRMGDQFWHMD